MYCLKAAANTLTAGYHSKTCSWIMANGTAPQLTPCVPSNILLRQPCIVLTPYNAYTAYVPCIRLRHEATLNHLSALCYDCYGPLLMAHATPYSALASP